MTNGAYIYSSLVVGFVDFQPSKAQALSKDAFLKWDSLALEAHLLRRRQHLCVNLAARHKSL